MQLPDVAIDIHLIFMLNKANFYFNISFTNFLYLVKQFKLV